MRRQCHFVKTLVAEGVNSNFAKRASFTGKGQIDPIIGKNSVKQLQFIN